MTFEHRWCDYEPLLCQISPKPSPRDFHSRFVNLSGSYFDGEYRFHFYDRQV